MFNARNAGVKQMSNLFDVSEVKKRRIKATLAQKNIQ